MSTYIDSHWFEAYRNLGTPSVLAGLKGDAQKRAETREAFLAGDIVLPELEYASIDMAGVERCRDACNVLRGQLESEENVAVREAYTGAIEAVLESLDLLTATHKGDDDAFRVCSESLYGAPRKETIERILPHVYNLIEVAKAEQQKDLDASILYLEEWIHGFGNPAGEPIAARFHFKEAETLDAPDIKRRLDSALDAYEIENWQVVIDREHKNGPISVDQVNNTVLVPEHRKVSPEYLEALVVHEIGVHVRRSVNAEETPLKLLTAGLGKYLRGDEGLAKLEECKVYPQALNATVEIYLTLASVYGYAGKVMNFRDIYTLSSHYFRVANANRELTQEQVDQHAYSMRAMRLFRGTTGLAEGICLTKDVSYFDGLLDIQRTLEMYPSEEHRLLIGKYDPSNAAHRSILNALNI